MTNKYDSSIYNKSLNLFFNDASSTSSYLETRLSHSYRCMLYENSRIIANLCNTLPAFSTKEGFDVKTNNETLDKEIENYLEEINALGLIKSRLIQAQIHGGSALWLFNAGSNLSGTAFQALIPLSMQEVKSKSPVVISDPLNPEFGYPSSYYINPTGVSTESYSVATERIIRFSGIKVERDSASKYNYFGKSFLEQIYSGVMRLEQSYQQGSQILEDFTKDVLKTDVMSMLSSNPEAFNKRLSYMQLTKNNKGIIAIDKEGEEYIQLNKNVSGIDLILNHLVDYLVIATGFPRMIILGESAKGLGASGDVELQLFYDAVRLYQKEYVKPALERIIEAKYPNLVDYTIEFRSLDKPNSEAIAKARKLNAETDAIYIESGVLNAEIVSRERFGSDVYSHDINLNEADLDNLLGSNEEEEAENGNL